MTTTNSTTTKAVTAVIECDANEHPYGITLSFANGKTLTLMETNLSEAMRARALWHGVSAKLVDATAISRNPDTGRSASVEDKYNAAREVYERLLAGQWNKVRGDGTGTTSAGGLLFRALCLVYSTKTPEQIREYLKGKTLTEQAALRKSSKLASVIEELRAKDAKDADPVDEDALFDGLED